MRYRLRGWHRGRRLPIAAQAITNNSIGPNRPSYVLEGLFAQIDEFRGYLAADLIVSGGRDAYSSRFGAALKPCGYIDATAKYVFAFDQHVAQIYSDTKQHAP